MSRVTWWYKDKINHKTLLVEKAKGGQVASRL